MDLQRILFLLSVFLYLLTWCGDGAEHPTILYVKPENSTSTCPGLCDSLTEYAYKKNFNSSTIFEFMDGTHQLDNGIFSLRNIDNISLNARNVSIQCSGVGQFLFDGIFNLSLTNMRFNSCGLNIVFPLSFPAIKLYNTVNAKLVNVSITHSRTDGLSIRNSTVELTNLLFQYNTAGSAGITIIDSTVSFEGENLFSKNLALFSNQKAVIYASNSHLTIDGSNQFLGNLAQYGAGLEAYNCSVASTGALNFSNNLGDSTVYFETSLVSLNGEVHFVNNGILSLERLGTLGAVNSSLYLNGEMAFVNNYGSVRVHESSVFLNGSMTFSDNTVTDHMRGVLDFTDSNVKLIGEINFFNNFANSSNCAGLFMSNSNVDIIGNCSFVGNSALFVSTFLALHKRFHITGRLTVTENVLLKSSPFNAVVLATHVCSVLVNGSFDVCDNIASGANTVMHIISIIEGNMTTDGNFTFTGNVASGTCMAG